MGNPRECQAFLYNDVGGEEVGSDLARFDSIEYIAPDPRDEYPVHRSCPTWYERWGDSRPAAPAEFQAARDFLQRRTGVVGDMTADSDARSRWLYAVAEVAFRDRAYAAGDAELAQ